MNNLQLAFRSLLKTPLITTVAVLSLALGIGANGAIFSLFEQIVLRELPVDDAGKLVNLLAPGPKPGSQSANDAGGMDAVFSYPMFRDLEAADTAFSGIAAHRLFGANLSYEGVTLSGEGMLVSGSYFPVLGLRPALGRLFTRDDDRSPGSHPLVVLSHAYWRSRFDADRGVLDRPLVVNGQPMTIVGVAPEGFSGTTIGQLPDVFVPISMRGQTNPGFDDFENRQSYWAYVFARLKPGVSLEQAQLSVNGVYRGIIQEVELPLQQGMSEANLDRFATKEVVLEEGRRGQSTMQQEIQAPLLLLLGVTGFVLLIAFANIANLLLVKATHRSGEIAIRMSLGARRHQIVRQLLAESFVLAVLGALVGVLVALVTMRFLIALVVTEGASPIHPELSGLTWPFLAGLTFVTGLVGLFPALHCTRRDLVSLIKTQGSKSSSGRGANRFRAAMVTLQVALSLALLTSAGLFTKSLLNVSRVELGLAEESLATFALSPELNSYEPAASRALFQKVEDEVAALPGVEGVVASRVPLIAGSNWGSNVSVQGFDAEPDTDTHSNFNEVGPGFFRTVGMRLLAGREFDERDALGKPKVAVVNETFARKFHLGTDAVGKRMQVGSGGENDIEIVGLVENAKYSSVKQEVPPLFFLPYHQNEAIGAMNFYVRTAVPPEQILPTLRKTVSAIDPNLPVEELKTLEIQIAENVIGDRVLTVLSTAFALLATLLAAVGLYGIMSYSVARRTREIGLRMALGADARRVRALILRQTGSLTAVGVILGVLAALGIGRAARSLLFELEGHDPVVFGLSVAVLALIVLGAAILPARRAASVDPIEALAEE